MRCDRCSQEIPEKDAREYYGQNICDDCYMDALSPARSRDPWAVYTAKSIAKSKGGLIQLNEIQVKIMQVLKDTGGVELPELVKKVGADAKTVEREFAALRHIEKVRAEIRGNKKVLTLW